MPAETAEKSDIRTLLRSRERDGAIAELADRQYGVVARDQLVRLGLEPGAIGRRVRAGRLHRLHAGVYSVGHRVIPREGRWTAAVLASGPEVVLSHWSAAVLWAISSTSMAGRGIRPARPFAMTALATGGCASPATPSPTSPGTSSTTNRRRLPLICGCCYTNVRDNVQRHGNRHPRSKDF
jgi:hypothetical protein